MGAEAASRAQVVTRGPLADPSTMRSSIRRSASCSDASTSTRLDQPNMMPRRAGGSSTARSPALWIGASTSPSPLARRSLAPHPAAHRWSGHQLGRSARGGRGGARRELSVGAGCLASGSSMTSAARRPSARRSWDSPRSAPASTWTPHRSHRGVVPTAIAQRPLSTRAGRDPPDALTSATVVGGCAEW